MVTNLLAQITTTIVTNWATTHIVTPVVSPSYWKDFQPGKVETYLTPAVYETIHYIQSGKVMSNTVAHFQYNGKVFEVILDSTVITNLTRDVYQ